MLQQIKLQGRELDYILKISSRARRLRLTIYGDGRLVLTQPRFLSRRFAEDFLREKAAWILARLDKAKESMSPLDSGLSGADLRADYLAKKADAYEFARTRLEHFNKFYNFTYQKISIRNPRTRWGSCSRKGNLNFSYRLLDLTPEAADYIIVHELCHLAQFNHSPRFWRLVSRTIPDYDERRRSLRNKIR